MITKIGGNSDFKCAYSASEDNCKMVRLESKHKLKLSTMIRYLVFQENLFKKDV
jgi:hypothetical protein